ncbi:hypothetical protein [Citreimonas sp.]|uniref:hypothetical protein n=1 Tax=Citreimonas sp. TaxID=3036715 RepID=UPI004058909A
MLDDKIAIIVGAGASTEFGLPVGAGLKQHIANLCSVTKTGRGDLAPIDPLMRNALKRIAESGSPRTTQDELDALLEIGRNMPLAPSIDNFLDTRQGENLIVEIGKACIALCILRAERNSTLSISKENYLTRLDNSNIEANWLAALFRILVSQRTFNDFIEAISSICFISFNYDRCIYQFLLMAAQSYFNLSTDQLKTLNENINVIYPYGSVGKSDFDQQGIQDFGIDPDPNQLLERSRNIKTFTEGADSDVIRDNLTTCRYFIFMGFGFIPLNMRLLFEGGTLEAKLVMGTCKGLSPDSKENLADDLKRYFGRRHRDGQWDSLGDLQVKLEDSTCRDFFWNFERRIHAIINR